MTVAPVRFSVDVATPPAQAFEVFTARAGAWWPKGQTVGAKPHVDVVIEPRPDGRWFERDADGNDTLWGKVLEWEPPRRVVLAWQLDQRFVYDPALVTEVEIRFEPLAAGGTRVTLEHRNLERFGADVAAHLEKLSRGWPKQLANFSEFLGARDRFVVHTVAGSSFGRSVLATLVEKGAAYRVQLVAGGTMRTETYRALHPFGRVPVLEHGDFRLYETQAILRYLDRILPDPALIPAGPKRAAVMDQVIGIGDWYLFQGVTAVIGFERIVKPRVFGGATDQARIEGAMPQAHLAFETLSGILGKQPFLAGPDFTLADLMIGPQLAFLTMTPEWPLLTEGRPNLLDWMARVSARPSFAATTTERVAAA